MQNRVWSFVIGIGVTLAISGLAHYYLRHQKYKRESERQNSFLEATESLDLRFSDIKYGFAGPRATQAKVALVAIDDQSIREIGRWPWGRDVMAQITDTLLRYQVKSIGMDVIWSEPDRAFPEQDQALADIVQKNASQVVLGTFSNERIHVKPYQDYCVTEAFVASGGESIAQINASFVVDDIGDDYDSLKWGRLFKPLFAALHEDTQTEYLESIRKDSIESLSRLQANFLAAEKNARVFAYCQRWLTEEDEFIKGQWPQVQGLYAELFSEKPDMAGLEPRRQIEKFKSDIVDFPVPQYGEWQGNIPVIQKASQYTASFVAYLDLDGYVRRYPLFYRSGNRIGTSFIPSLALQTYLSATGYRGEVKIEKVGDQKRITSFQIIDSRGESEKTVMNLPVDPQGRLLVNYYGPKNTLPQISAKDLLSDSDTIEVSYYQDTDSLGQDRFEKKPVNRREFLKDRAVILGATSIGVYDIRSTPVDSNFPGPEIHLTVLANLLDGDFIRSSSSDVIVLPLAILLVGIVLTAILSFVGASVAFLCMIVVLVLGFFVDRYVFLNLKIMTASLFLFVELIFIHFAMLFYKYFSEERKRGELKRTFSKYVAPAVVEELLKNEENLKLGGRKEEMTVFFTDVRGFTKFSEKMDPQELSLFLSEYLTPMTEVIFKNKGTLDKYMGDGVMAFFGAPVPYKDHAYSACKCALDSLDELKKLQDEFAKRDWPHIDIGIGINTGFMSVGNMGSKIVQSYTVIGDAVNLGSRLESATKEYGVRILISESTYSLVKDQFVAREVDRVRVKGKKEPVRAFELICEAGRAHDSQWLDSYNEGYQLYHAREFLKAQERFSQIETSHPQDALSRIYRERCAEYLAAPPPDSWDGVYEMQTK